MPLSVNTMGEKTGIKHNQYHYGWDSTTLLNPAKEEIYNATNAK